MDVWIIFYVGRGLELKHMEKGEIELPWDDFIPPARQAGSRNFNWSDRGWRALPKIFSTCATGLRLVLY